MNSGNGNNFGGGGNVFGNGNTIVINKSRNTIHQNSHNKKDDGPENLIGAGIVLAITISAAAFLFARHANQFYAATLILAAFQSLLALMAAGLEIWQEQPSRYWWRALFVSVLAASLMFSTDYAWDVYPQEMVRLAQKATSSSSFWCALNDYGHSLALQHLLVAVTLTASLLLLLPHTLEIAARNIGEPSALINRVLVRLAPTWTCALAVLTMMSTWMIPAFAGNYLSSLAASIGPLICRGV